MNEQLIVDLLRNTFQTALIVVGPLLLSSMVVGLLISIAQVVTSIQDPTLSFVPRMMTILIMVLVLLSWMLTKLTEFTIGLFSRFSVYLQ